MSGKNHFSDVIREASALFLSSTIKFRFHSSFYSIIHFALQVNLPVSLVDRRFRATWNKSSLTEGLSKSHVYMSVLYSIAYFCFYLCFVRYKFIFKHASSGIVRVCICDGNMCGGRESSA